MAYYEQPPYTPPSIPTPEQQKAMQDQYAQQQSAPTEEPEPGPPIPDAPPPNLPPAPSNSPLALPGSFAQPGTKGAAPYHTGGFLAERLVSPMGPIRFAQGIGFGPGGASPLANPGGGGRPGESDDERARALIASMHSRR